MKKVAVGMVVASIFSVNALASSDGAKWGYTGHAGPENWGEISEKYKTCGVGVNQSPIDIRGSIEAELEPIAFNYNTSPEEILNNGHTIQVNVAPGSSIKIDGISFELKQYHFHTPSENQINGQSFPLEGHLVHADKNGNLAVIGVMFKEGDANEQIAQLWNKMPKKAGLHNKLSGEAKNLVALLPDSREYYRFNGSLTTPPCTEGVRWLVLKEPVVISRTQVEAFEHVVHANNRPVQKLHARVVLK